MRRHTSLDSFTLNLWMRFGWLNSFFNEKVISTRATQRNVKKTWNGNLFVEVDSQRNAENILKMNTSTSSKCKEYPLEKLKISKVMKSRELSLAMAEEIRAALGNRSHTFFRRITIRKVKEEIQTNTYILT